ncbi:unnamed protein product [Soboliphyme baturini]|uniref:Myosin_tail_1 domain-containing protein n=1 Tax=Soboliphyme baturini TaxID=241478 RepID=A0A183J6D2_9BILA|nr:unnamed protein product [Soboliphyme baturini]
MQHEVIELTASIDQLQKDKHLAEKAAEKFEMLSRDLQNKVEDLLKNIDDVSQQRQRLQQENSDILKDLHDSKERSQMQAQFHQVQLELDSVTASLEEESTLRTEAEHKLSLANTEITQWKSKFDAEIVLHQEELVRDKVVSYFHDFRKKMIQKQAEYEEQIEIMLQKISQLEKAKSRLQSEVEVLIVDLEKAQNQIAILERQKEQLEKLAAELKARLDELSQELEALNRELKNTQAELQKMKHLYEKAVEQREALARENKKLQGIVQFLYDYLLLESSKRVKLR